MNIIPQSSLFLGVIPALILLYITIKHYEGIYKDKTMFISFVAGILMGFVAALAQSVTIALVIIYVALLAVFNQMFKTVVLNIGRFQKNKETPLYGLSLGLGFGSSFTPFMILALSAFGIDNVYVLLVAGIGSFGIILFHAATGCLIGYGVFQGKLIKNLLIAILIELPFAFLIGFLIIYSKTEFLRIQVGFAIAAIFYGLIVYGYVTKKVLPKILTKSEKRKRSKKS